MIKKVPFILKSIGIDWATISMKSQGKFQTWRFIIINILKSVYDYSIKKNRNNFKILRKIKSNV